MKVNQVVLRGVNDRTIPAMVTLVHEAGAKALKLIELLVLPGHRMDYSLFCDQTAMEPALARIADGPEIRSARHQRYRLRADPEFAIELTRCTCQLGCARCHEFRDRMIGNDLRYQPCFVLSKTAYPVDTGLRLAAAMVKGDALVDTYAAQYGERSPTLVKKAQYVARRRQAFFAMADADRWRRHLAARGYRLDGVTAFSETYFQPRRGGRIWREFRRAVKLRTVRHRPGLAEVFAAQYRYRPLPGGGLEVVTVFAAAAGPQRYASEAQARSALAHQGLTSTLTLDWELETWVRQGLSLSLGCCNGHTIIGVLDVGGQWTEALAIVRAAAAGGPALTVPLPQYCARPALVSRPAP